MGVLDVPVHPHYGFFDGRLLKCRSVFQKKLKNHRRSFQNDIQRALRNVQAAKHQRYQGLRFGKRQAKKTIWRKLFSIGFKNM